MAENKIEWLLAATDRASPVFRGVQSSMERLQGSYSQLMTLLGGAGVVGGLGLMLKGALETGDQLNKMSQKVGISVESLSQLKFGAELADVGVEQLGTGLKKFNGALVEAANPTSKMAAVFQALGVDVRAGPEQVLKQFATAVSQLADGELKTTLATQVLGKAGMELIPWLNGGGKGMEEAAASAKKLGIVMSAETAKAAEELNDNMKKLHTGAQALGLTLANQTAGGLATLTGELVKAKEEGNLFVGVMKELMKVNLALLSKVPGPIGALAGAAADKAFAGDGKAPPVSGVIRRPGAPAVDVPPDVDALTRALSGQKDPKDEAAKRYQEFLEVLAKGSLKRIDMADKTAEELEKIEDKWNESLSRGAQTRQEMQDKADEARLKKEQEFNDMMQQAALARMRVQDAVDQAAEDAAKKTSTTMRDLGFVMSSSFESAALSILGLTDRMASARDVARGLIADLAKVILRKGVTDPLADVATGFISQTIKSWGLAGAKADGGPVMGGSSYLVGERGPEIFTPASSGHITPNGGGGTTINITYNPTGNGGAADAQSMAATLVPMVRSIVRGEITTQLRPGGAFA